jgi:carboxynorspermidine decarboxylase
MKTPYYLIDESRLLENLKKIAYVREHSGAKMLLALKCFSTWSVFPLIKKYMDGTTSSSLYEARLGYEEFGKETHAYCVGYSADDIKQVKGYSDKIIFNSLSQYIRHYSSVKGKTIGIRVNPGFSYSHFDLADPSRDYSRLGTPDGHYATVLSCLNKISGVMFHYNCENEDFNKFCEQLDELSGKFSELLKKVSWVSLGGGVLFTKKGYPYQSLAVKLRQFAKKHDVQVYLEPGEAVITGAGELVTSVVDLICNRKDIAIVDASAEAHMLDLIIYRYGASIGFSGPYKYQIAGRSCLAGDIFGEGSFKRPLHIGDEVRIKNAAGYTMVKRTWFNGLQSPSIVVKKLNGSLKVIREFNYGHYKNNL